MDYAVWAAPMEAPRDINVPVPKPVPVATPSPTPSIPPPAPAPTPALLYQPSATAPAPAPATTATTKPVPPSPSEASAAKLTAESKPSTPISASVRRELEHEGYQGMPGRTRRETRALRNASRESSHRHDILSTVYDPALVFMLATRQSVDEAVRTHCVPNSAPDLTTPNTTSDVEKSPHADAWRYSINKEFGGLLQADTLPQVPA